MKTCARLLLTAGLGMALACDGSSEAQNEVEDQVQAEVEEAKRDVESEEGTASGAPKVAETHQRTINRGWEKAVAGETPAYACAGLKGRVMAGEEPPDADEQVALFACNVLLPVRYFETLLEQVEAGEKTCSAVYSTMSMQLPAMTLSLDSIQGMADALGGEDAEAEPDVEKAGEALAEAVGRAALEEGLTDPERAIKDRLEESVRRVCPDQADSILR